MVETARLFSISLHFVSSELTYINICLIHLPTSFPPMYFSQLARYNHGELLLCPFMYVTSEYAVEARGVIPACEWPAPGV